jgi:hypothetical protein
MIEEDPIVEEIRRRAMSISARYGHDPRKYLEHLREVQARERHLLVNQPTVVHVDDARGQRGSPPQPT